MANGYLLSAHAVKQLEQNYNALRLEVQSLNARIETDRWRPHGTELREDAVIFKAAEEITARSGTTLGSGTANIHHKENGGTATGDSGRVQNVYNVSETAISSGDYFRAVREFKSGDWLAEAAEGGGSTTVIDADISYVVAQSYWTYTGSEYPSTTSELIASVQVKKCDADGTATGSAFTCLLPVCNTGCDPNVVTGQIFTAAKFTDPSDSSETWAALSGHEDAAIGTVRMLTGNFPADETTGWAKMDGSENAANGSGIDMTGAVPKHDCSVSAGTSNGGTADPSTTTGATAPSGTTSSGTTGSSGTLTTSSASGTTGAAGSHTHTVSVSGTTSGSGTLTTSTHSAALTWGEDDMSYLETVAGFSAVDNDGDGDPDAWTHNHTIASHTHTFSDSATTSTSGSHTHTIGSHSHDVASHTHTIPALSVSVNAHTHTTQKQLTVSLCFYERIDNSS